MRRFSVVLLVLYVVGLPSVVLADDQRVTKKSSPQVQELLIMTGEWTPYVSTTMPNNGFIAEIITQACLAANLKASISFAPWPRCEAAVQHGKAFGSFPYSSNATRTEFAVFSRPIARSRTVLFYDKEKFPNFSISSLADLKSYLIGGVRGYYYEPGFTKAGLSVDYSRNEDDALKKLFYGRVDIIPLNELVGRQSVIRLFPDKGSRIIPSVSALDENDLTLMVSRSYPGADDLLKRFNGGLEEIMQNGLYEKIMQKHNIPLSVGVSIP